MRYAIGVEYLGSSYFGWQRQIHSKSVQEEVEKAFSLVADSEIKLSCAGRTDTGVHATGQVAHFDTVSLRSDSSWLRGANAHLPKEIKIKWVKEVSDDFHSRFSAIERKYQYIIYNSKFNSAILNDRVTWIYSELDIDAMNDAARSLVGEHDFSCFRSSRCQAHSPIRTMVSAKFFRSGQYIFFEIKGNGFLHHMVRNIIGSLLDIGRGKKDSDYIQQLITQKDRRLASKTAAANGLYLVGVSYPSEFNIPIAITAKDLFISCS
jgi:tRNA pseudouridine38-40 synthase